MTFRIKELLDSLTFPLYIVRRRRPWSPGYYTAKKKAITNAIDIGIFKHINKLPRKYGYGIDERVVEYPWLFSKLGENPGRVLDAGSALNHHFLLDRSPLKDAQLTIMTLAPEKRCFWNRAISYVYADLRKPFFADGIFDVVVSVSTIEHIGLDNTLLYTSDPEKKESNTLGFVHAVAEFRRVLRSGGVCLLTVPFGRRGVHGWYQVFDHDLVMKVVETFAPSEYTIDYFGYDADGWHQVLPEDVADAEFYDIHERKPLEQDNAAGARGVACLKLIV